MLHQNLFTLRLLSLAIILCGTLSIGCKNNDTNDETETGMDTSASTVHEPAPMPDTSMTTMPAPVTSDTAMAGSNMDSKINAGTAKPNAAKKGMKGKVTITIPPKMTGSMEADESGVYSNVEVYPSFPGGNEGLQKYFDTNLEYPEKASNDGVEGTVQVMFTVDENGKLAAPHVMGNSLGYGLEEEALRVVKQMPVWNPGKLKGKNVKTKYTLPVRFQLY